MPKEGDLWDDSVLMKAFDQAISKYKKIHIQGYKENSDESTEVESVNEEAPTVIDGIQVFNSPELDSSVGHGSQTVSQMEQPSHPAALEGNTSEDMKFPKDGVDGSQYIPTQDPSQSNSGLLEAEDYNQLYHQYYEIEEKRQNILQKLQQFGGWNYSNAAEGSASYTQWDASSVPQTQQSYTNQASQPVMFLTCCPCNSQCNPGSCPFIPVCSLPRTCTCTCGSDCPKDVSKESLGDESEIVKTAMGAAYKTISFLKEGIADTNEKHKSSSEMPRSEYNNTDFTAVLNAWFSAGLQTGKYLTERSLSKK